MAIHDFSQVFERLVAVIGTGQLVGLTTPAGRITGYVETIRQGHYVVLQPYDWVGGDDEPIVFPMRHIKAVAYVTLATASGNRMDRF